MAVTVKQFIPREHGTWAMLLVPFAVGCGVARRFGISEILLAVAVLLFFLAQNQLMNWVRLRSVTRPEGRALFRARILFLIEAAIGTLALLPLIWIDRLTGLFFFGALALGLTAFSLKLVLAKKDRSGWGQILAAAGLSLSAPLAHYVARGKLEHRAFELWVMSLLFFLGGIFYVQLKIDALAEKTSFASLATRFRFAGRMLLYDVLIIVVAFTVVQQGSISPWVLLAFVPTLIQALIGTIRLNRPAKLKRIGILATAYSVLFAVVMIWLA